MPFQRWQGILQLLHRKNEFIEEILWLGAMQSTESANQIVNGEE